MKMLLSLLSLLSLRIHYILSHCEQVSLCGRRDSGGQCWPNSLIDLRGKKRFSSHSTSYKDPREGPWLVQCELQCLHRPITIARVWSNINGLDQMSNPNPSLWPGRQFLFGSQTILQKERGSIYVISGRTIVSWTSTFGGTWSKETWWGREWGSETGKEESQWWCVNEQVSISDSWGSNTRCPLRDSVEHTLELSKGQGDWGFIHQLHSLIGCRLLLGT